MARTSGHDSQFMPFVQASRKGGSHEDEVTSAEKED